MIDAVGIPRLVSVHAQRTLSSFPPPSFLPHLLQAVANKKPHNFPPSYSSSFFLGSHYGLIFCISFQVDRIRGSLRVICIPFANPEPERCRVVRWTIPTPDSTTRTMHGKVEGRTEILTERRIRLTQQVHRSCLDHFLVRQLSCAPSVVSLG
jgi:hypothetical protein